MTPTKVFTRFQSLSTAHVADALVRFGRPTKIALGGIVPLVPGMKVAGPASPVALFGHADTLLEGIYASSAGDVLVVDNKSRDNEACFGDLAAYEARSHGLAGVVICGRHRDSAELREIGFPVFSYGTYPLGMQRSYVTPSDPLARCQFGDISLERGEIVFADDDGVLFVPADETDQVLDAAEALGRAERDQVDKIRAGTTLREQMQFDRFLEAKKKNPDLTLGEHMKSLGRSF